LALNYFPKKLLS